MPPLLPRSCQPDFDCSVCDRDAGLRRIPSIANWNSGGVDSRPQHKVMARVEVQLSRVDASQPVSHAITDIAGRFEFVGLPAGVYSLELNLPGWQGQHFSHLNIDTARTLDVNILLMPALPTLNRQIRSLQLFDRDVLVGWR